MPKLLMKLSLLHLKCFNSENIRIFNLFPKVVFQKYFPPLPSDVFRRKRHLAFSARQVNHVMGIGQTGCMATKGFHYPDALRYSCPKMSGSLYQIHLVYV